MNKNHKILLWVLVLAIAIFALYWYYPTIQKSDTPSSDPALLHIDSKKDLIKVESPTPYEIVSSPLTIIGEARGGWYFEGDFPIRLLDANGKVLATHYATAKGEWMSEDFVSFESIIEFNLPETETGTIILHKDNPSGLQQYDDELRIPVRFNQNTIVPENDQRAITLYYYNSLLDQDANGNVLCSNAGLVAVERKIPVTMTPIQDTIRLLIQGEITPSEIERGITTEYPLSGFELRSASLSDGTLTLEFSDPKNTTSGGSCRAGILWKQIEKTVLQFTEVKEVRFIPEELFQP